MTSGGGLDVGARPGVSRAFPAVSGELDQWEAIDHVLASFHRVDLHRVFLYLVRNSDLVELLPDIAAALERHFGLGRPLSLRVIEEFAASGSGYAKSMLRIGLGWPGGVEKAQHLLAGFDDIWDLFYEPSAQGRVLVNYDY